MWKCTYWCKILIPQLVRWYIHLQSPRNPLSKHENDALKTLIKMNMDNHYEKLRMPKAHYLSTKTQKITHIQLLCIVVTYEIRVFFEGAKKEAFSSVFKKTL